MIQKVRSFSAPRDRHCFVSVYWSRGASDVSAFSRFSHIKPAYQKADAKYYDKFISALHKASPVGSMPGKDAGHDTENRVFFRKGALVVVMTSPCLFFHLCAIAWNARFAGRVFSAFSLGLGARLFLAHLDVAGSVHGHGKSVCEGISAFRAANISNFTYGAQTSRGQPWHRMSRLLRSISATCEEFFTSRGWSQDCSEPHHACVLSPSGCRQRSHTTT